MTAPLGPYQARCAELAPDLDPAWVEAVMRASEPTMDHLPADEFDELALAAAEAIRQFPAAMVWLMPGFSPGVGM